LKHEDRNTKFFYVCANQRKKANQIYKIEDEQGTIWESQGEVEKTFVNYFSGLFSADSIGNLEPCIADLEERVSGTMNDDLMKPFIAEEVSFVLHQMGLLKASSLDGVYGLLSKPLGHCRR
jgi:hypothetical protein